MKLKIEIIVVAILLLVSLACITSSPDMSSEDGLSQRVITDTPVGDSMNPFDQFPCIPDDSEIETAQVIEVIDGDTVEVRLDGENVRVRYIGVDTPERDDTYYTEASQYNASLVEGQQVRMIKDVSETDDYGRLLRYILAGDIFVNYELAIHGYAETIYYPPDTACADTFSDAVEEARGNHLGMWGDGEGYTRTQVLDQTRTVIISDLFYDGNSENEGDEYVEITNQSTESIDLKGWTLSDNTGVVFTFPDYLIGSGNTCRIYTNQYHTDWCGFNARRKDTAIWNNSGDCATLKDIKLNVIDNYCY